ncbi:DNA-processing protein DprA [Rhizobacter sp. LjRoot28]|uniref:DNA-processing protein DprA n=1 Tax=Rhizobacter sp. LjRoot28 TaxID=3342309 RepID=UPI003ECD72E0
MATDLGELPAWLRLAHTPGLGRRAARALLKSFGSAAAVLDAPREALRHIAGDAACQALVSSGRHATLVDATLAWLAAAPSLGVDRRVIPLGDPAYPTPLLHAPDPPLLLHVEGNAALLCRPSVAVVGSRKASAQGLANAEALSRDLAAAGLTVVSGLALGIDGAAHQGALGHPASTVAVVGTGLDIDYPRRHAALAADIRARGAIVSEHPLGTTPLPAHFPQRNRIIAGLSQGTLVIEAALASGSLITARLAADMGREVWALPGSIHAAGARGCHALIKNGAKLVESVADVLEELPSVAPAECHAATPPGRGRVPAAPSLPDALLDAIGHDPADLDTLAARTGQAAPALLARLFELELGGHIERLPGERYQRLVRA